MDSSSLLAWLATIVNTILWEGAYEYVASTVGVVYKTLREDIVAKLLAFDVVELYRNPKPRELVLVGAFVFYGYKILSQVVDWLLQRRNKKSAASLTKDAGGETDLAMPGRAFLATLPTRVGSKTKRVKTKRGQSYKGKIMGKVKGFAFALVLYFGVGYAFGSSNDSSDFTRAMIANNLKEGAMELVSVLLPRASWHKESALSWIRVAGVAATMYAFFVWLLEANDDVFIKNAAGTVLYHTVDVALTLLHLEKWQRYLPKLAFVLYWKLFYKSMIAYIAFGLKFAFDLMGYLGEKVEDKVRRPYSIVIPWAMKMLILAPLAYGAPLLFETWSKKKIMRLHKNKTVLMFQLLWGVSAEKTYYQILGVPDTANEKEIKKAFRQHSRRLHPDKNPDPAAQELFMKIKDAYNNLLKKGSKEDVRMKQFEANTTTLRFVMDVLIVGMPYMFTGVLLTVNMLYKLFKHFSVERARRKYQEKDMYSLEEYKAFLESQACLELCIRGGKSGPIKEHATKWLHPLKRAIAFKVKESFKPEIPDEVLKQQLTSAKYLILGKKKSANQASRQEEDDDSRFLADIDVMDSIEKRSADLVSFGHVHRLMHLYHKKVLVSLFLEEYSKKDEQEALGKEIRDLDDLITTYTEELDAYGQQMDFVYDLAGLVDESSLKRSLRYYFRKELRSKDRLLWIKSLAQAPWHEFPVHLYTQKLSKYR